MSVGLIQDINMDNMKSLEQDINKHQPSPKMNDEQKMKEEMYVPNWSMADVGSMWPASARWLKRFAIVSAVLKVGGGQA